MRRFARQLFAQVFCITLVLLSFPDSNAQHPVQQQSQRRGSPLSNIRREVSVDHVARQKLLAQLALRNDFRKLQVVNNDLMKRVFKPLDDQQITDKEIVSRLGEIKKLAERLRESFGLPRIEEAGEPADSLTPPTFTLKPGLLQLDEAIVRFVDNPVFGELRVYNAEHGHQAAKDLNEVARLAGALRRLVREK